MRKFVPGLLWLAFGVGAYIWTHRAFGENGFFAFAMVAAIIAVGDLLSILWQRHRRR